MALVIRRKSPSATPAKARISALAIPMPPPDDEAAEGESEESGETCHVTLSRAQLQDALDNGSDIEAQADDGETVVIHVGDEESAQEDAQEPGEGSENE